MSRVGTIEAVKATSAHTTGTECDMVGTARSAQGEASMEADAYRWRGGPTRRCRSMLARLGAGAWLLGAPWIAVAQPGAVPGVDDDGRFAVATNLRAGVAKVDITPARVDGLTVVGHRRPVTGVRDPLRAGVLVLDDGDTRAANVTLDTIGA